MAQATRLKLSWVFNGACIIGCFQDGSDRILSHKTQLITSLCDIDF